jgi:hypothetical protein
LLWTGAGADWGRVGGCPGIAPGTLNRSLGSGTRATYCNSLYGLAVDLCASANVGGAANAPTTSDMIADVCGIPGGEKLQILRDYTRPASGSAMQRGPLGPRIGSDSALREGVIGYASRAGVLAPYTSYVTGDPDPITPLAGCGLVGLNGMTGWNGTCNPNSPSTTGGVTNPGNGRPLCKGDLQVALGQYMAWGYEHLETSGAFTNPLIPAFLAFLRSAAEQRQLFTFGFLRECQMDVWRAVDTGPYAATTPTC